MNYNQSMEEVSVGTLLERYNLIVPEIQREYVWGNNYNNILVTFFNDIKEGIQGDTPGSRTAKKAAEFLETAMAKADPGVREVIEQMIKVTNRDGQELNIGFLYSYRPDYFVFNDRSEDINLIDGQQRFTTLFFMLFYFAIREDRKDDFLALFRFDAVLERIAFDYRVRTLTHSFFIDLVAKTDELADLIEIDRKNWFLSNYNGDMSVRSIVFGMFPLLHDAFKADERPYFNFLRDKVKFWHFRTEETSQGEELYITMNSRGQQLADNETLRAKLFEPDAVRRAAMHWSERWEIWQDFFWKKRNKTEPSANADAGFNEFLRWVQILKMIEKQRIILDDGDEESTDKKEIIQAIKWEKDCQLDVAFLPLPEIDAYFHALVYLYETFPKALKAVAPQYPNYQNFELLDTKWLHPENGTINQRELFRLLPVLFYVKRLLVKEHRPDSLNVFRLTRFLYNLRQNDTIIKTAGIQTINAVKLIRRLGPDDDVMAIMNQKSESILNAEERFKFKLLKENKERVKTEDQFWLAEDMAYNKGEISFLLNWSITETSGVFQLKPFTKMLAAYTELINAEDDIRWDLLTSKAFIPGNDRVAWNGSYFKETDFLAFALKWYKSKGLTLHDFLVERRKSFIRSYKMVEGVQNEAVWQKQIYIYYIINEHLLKKNENWIWDNINFGVYRYFESARSIFNVKYIFQHYNIHFRQKYEKVIWIQRDLKLGARKIQAMLEWANQ